MLPETITKEMKEAAYAKMTNPASWETTTDGIYCLCIYLAYNTSRAEAEELYGEYFRDPLYLCESFDAPIQDDETLSDWDEEELLIYNRCVREGIEALQFELKKHNVTLQ